MSKRFSCKYLDELPYIPSCYTILMSGEPIGPPIPSSDKDFVFKLMHWLNSIELDEEE